MTSTWQDPRPGCSSHNKLGLRQEVGEGGEERWEGDGLDCQANYHSRRTGKAPGCLSRKERPRAPLAQRQRMSDLSLPPTSPLCHCPEPRPLGQSRQNQQSRQQKAPNTGVREKTQGRCGRPYLQPHCLGYWDREGSSSFRTPPTRCRLPVTSTWMAAASRSMLAPLPATGWARRPRGGLGG